MQLRQVCRILLSCATLALGFSRPTFAADLGVFKAPLIAPFSWAGLYAGAHLGYILNDPELVASSFTTIAGGGLFLENASTSPPGSLNGPNTGRFEGGVQAGFNMQTGIWVYGLEADISGGRRRIGTNASSNLNFLSTPGNPFVIQNFSAAEAEVDWYGTVRGRLGVARDRWLVYASGGLAYGEVKVTNTSNPFLLITTGTVPPVGATSAVTTSHTKAGWAAGAGAAYAWSEGVSVFAEWTRINLGNDTAQTGLLVPIPTTGSYISFVGRSDVTNQFDVIQVGVNVKIN